MTGKLGQPSPARLDFTLCPRIKIGYIAHLAIATEIVNIQLLLQTGKRKCSGTIVRRYTKDSQNILYLAAMFFHELKSPYNIEYMGGMSGETDPVSARHQI